MNISKSLFALCFLSISTLGSAQFAEHALGLRFSGDDDADGVGAEISYQAALGANNRAEVNLGLRDSRHVDVVKLTGFYQWVWPLEKGFNWYIGPGAGIGLVDYDNDWPLHRDNDYANLFLVLAGDIGIEYIFEEVPLQLALDARPQLFLADNFYDDFDIDIGFAIRYQFR